VTRHPTLYITHRGERHQNAALEGAPAELEITILRSPSKEQIIEMLPGMEFLISERSGVIDADIISAGSDLRLIQRLGSLTYDIDLLAARKANIKVCYLPVMTCVMVAEHMVAQMLMLAKRFREMMHITVETKNWGDGPKRSDEDTFAYNWSDRKDIRGLYESTVGIVGFGEIGAELARRLKPFGCEVLYNKRTTLPAEAESDLNIHYIPLNNLLKRSDYICMLLPYFQETDQIVNKEFIGKMKKGACLVSCGASGILNENDVSDALIAGDLYGVATDTYVYEPIHSENPLLPLARQPETNIVLTPHTAAGSTAVTRDERVKDYVNLINFIQNKTLRFQVV
jgi:lactate dehydrogenase-like 2-hydroxyacid dehydrogenase